MFIKLAFVSKICSTKQQQEYDLRIKHQLSCYEFLTRVMSHNVTQMPFPVLPKKRRVSRVATEMYGLNRLQDIHPENLCIRKQ